MDWRARVRGHRYTVGPWLRHVLSPTPLPPGAPWSTCVDDPKVGRVRLTGRLGLEPRCTPDRAGARRSSGETPDDLPLVIVVHGLGGNLESHYVRDAAQAATRAGLPHLLLNLRGADFSGDDMFHAALTDDFDAVMRSPALATRTKMAILGYSIGGHLALRYATESPDSRLVAVAAICPPLDLARSVAVMDRPEKWVYRKNILIALKEAFAAIARRRGAGVPFDDVRRIDTFRAWDEHVVGPRFGFSCVDRYYAEASVAPRLSRVRVPALVVVSDADPIVTPESVCPVLGGVSGLVDVRWVRRGGHVGFAGDVDLGMPGPRGLEAQVIRWITEQAS